VTTHHTPRARSEDSDQRDGPSGGAGGVLAELVGRACRVAGANYGCVILPTEGGRLRVTVAVGRGAEDFRGLVFDARESVLGKAILAAEPIRTHDMTLWARLDFDNRHRYGPAVIIPLVAHAGPGAMLLIRVQGRLPFSAHDAEIAATFAAQIALAIELTETRAAAQRLRTLAERHRLAQDLHDDLIQRLFATGMGLQALVGQLSDEALAERLRQHIADLDETLDHIRSTVFEPRDDTRPESLQETAVPGTAPRRDVMS
jgi:signal transduction histidine kinase